MGCSNPAGNIEVVPMKVLYGNYECSTVVCTADVASSHNNDYFVLYRENDTTKYHVWYNVGGAGVDPAPLGSTPIPVAIAVSATAEAVATATAAAIDGLAGGYFTSTSDGASVCICNMQPGPSTDVAAGVGLAGFTYTVNVQGSYVNLGFVDGDIEPNFEVQSLEVTAHQTGTTILTNIVQGKTISLELALQETTDTNWELVFGQVGKVGTPTGGTVDVVAWGTGGNGLNLINKAGKLILHPYNLSDSDRSKDLAFWLASLVPSSVVFSGENPTLMNCTFTAYFDDSRQADYNIFVRGDHLQAGNFKA